jgi:DNA-binding PadR family transcriptional regulator
MTQKQLKDLLLRTLLERGELYGVELMHQINECCSYGAMYAALESLEQDGRIASRLGDATPERGNRRKRYFRIAQEHV